MFKSGTDYLWNSNDDEEETDAFIDDSLAPLERIRTYYYRADARVHHRLYAIKDLVDVAQQVGFEETSKTLLPMLQDIKCDTDPAIRQALVDQIPTLCDFLKEAGGSEGYLFVWELMLPIVSFFTTDTNQQVRHSAMDCLVSLAGKLHHEDLQPHLLPLIKSLSKDMTDEEHRVEAAELMNFLAPIVGPELCLNNFIPLVTTLTTDPMFRVRKAVASNLGNICRTIGSEQTTNLVLPLFIKLSQDEIWGVRKACAESLVHISENISPEERQNKLVQVFEKLISDPSRWVKSTAFQALGPFIATFRNLTVPEILLKFFNSMVMETKDSKLGDSDNVTFCAFNFPAVLQTIGREKWNLISDTYHLLVKDVQWKVRRSLSFSLHVIADILGSELTEKILLSIFELFLRDLPEVKVGVLTHLSKFLEVLSTDTRERYINVLEEVINNDDNNWRFHKLIAEQMGSLSKLYSPTVVSEKIVPIVFRLLADPVSAVRKSLLPELGGIIRSLDESPEQQKKFQERLVSFGRSPTYQPRLLFSHLCAEVLYQIDIQSFSDVFLPVLLNLKTDVVPNVRFTVANTLRVLLQHDKLKHHVEIIQALQLLQQDKDRDVITSAKGNGDLPFEVVPDKNSGSSSLSSDQTPNISKSNDINQTDQTNKTLETLETPIATSSKEPTSNSENIDEPLHTGQFATEETETQVPNEQANSNLEITPMNTQETPTQETPTQETPTHETHNHETPTQETHNHETHNTEIHNQETHQDQMVVSESTKSQQNEQTVQESNITDQNGNEAQ
eukprot:TRINITY_DN964_c0_g1_i4.p1 TRINITY_DN964_c0_g1~~TRINITY_DN964_c0_g1_i4.p1  ORF type:complete len:787 (+),score=169.29 TRINITY_DN964_c0_g1_i4:71-2431(+)